MLVVVSLWLTKGPLFRKKLLAEWVAQCHRLAEYCRCWVIAVNLIIRITKVKNLQIIKKLKIPEGKYFCSSCPNMFVGKKAEKRFVNKTRSGKTEIHIILSVIDLSKNPARKKLTAPDPFLSKWLCTLQQIVGVKSGGGTSFCVNTEKDFLSKFHR